MKPTLLMLIFTFKIVVLFSQIQQDTIDNWQFHLDKKIVLKDNSAYFETRNEILNLNIPRNETKLELTYNSCVHESKTHQIFICDLSHQRLTQFYYSQGQSMIISLNKLRQLGFKNVLVVHKIDYKVKPRLKINDKPIVKLTFLD